MIIFLKKVQYQKKCLTQEIVEVIQKIHLGIEPYEKKQAQGTILF